MPSSSTEISQKLDALERLREGDEEAFGELFARFRSRLFQIVSVRMDRRLAGRVDADDILQEVYLDAASRIEHFVHSHSGSFFVWLRLITTQTMANVYRRHLVVKMRDARRDVSIHSAQTSETYEAPRSPIAMQLLGRLTSPSHVAIRQETLDQIEQAIGSMKEIDREIIVLRHFEQLENKEIAEVLGIHEKAASIRYVRALSRLKDLVVGMSEAPDSSDDSDADETKD